MVLKVMDRLAAFLTALMMGLITALVWIPALLAQPQNRFTWTAIVISTLLWAGACVVAESFRDQAWLAGPWSVAERKG